MGDQMRLAPNRKITVSQIASFLKADMHGKDLRIESATSLEDIAEHAVGFFKGSLSKEVLRRTHHACLIGSELPDTIYDNAFLIVKNPRLSFAKILKEFFVSRTLAGIGKHTVIHPTAIIGKDVFIGNGCSVGRDVVIGDYTEVRNNVVIADGVRIGKHCLIRSNAVIGEEGFGFEYEEDGTPFRIPHLGSVEIGDHVEIGNFTAIAQGTLKNTIIHSHVKIDNLVHIAHNCVVGERTVIVAGAETSGSSVIGTDCWLGVGCTTMQKIKIGDNSLVGIGSVVLRDVPPGVVVAGNPARILRMRGIEE